MKNYKHSRILLTCFLLLTIVSCKKTDLDPATSSNATDAENAQGANAQCLVTHTEDDLFGYTLDIFYNKAGNPDSMSLYGSFPITMQYDSKGRLIRSNFGTEGVRYDYLYKNNSVLPAAINFYYPGTTPLNGLYAIYKLEYNSQGQIIKLGINNLSSPQYNAVEKYEYNAMNNVARVSYVRLNGTSSYIENEASTYDNKPNLIGGNKWLKFILYNNGAAYVIDYFRMLSKNNAVNWTVGYDGGYNPFVSVYEYNSYGFANKVITSILDLDGTDLLDYTQLSSSTCDAAPLKSQLLPLNLKKKSSIPFKNPSNLPSTIPPR